MIYALTGYAQDRGYVSVEPIWRDHPWIPELKVHIGDMIDLALEQCR